MSQQDIDALRSGYEAFNRGDIPSVLQILDSEVEWNEPGGGNAPSGTFHRPDSVGQDVLATIPQNFEEFTAETDQFRDEDGRVIVTGRLRGKSKSGEELDTAFEHVWEMRTARWSACRTTSTTRLGRGPGVEAEARSRLVTATVRIQSARRRAG